MCFFCNLLSPLAGHLFLFYHKNHRKLPKLAGDFCKRRDGDGGMGWGTIWDHLEPFGTIASPFLIHFRIISLRQKQNKIKQK